MFFKFFGKLIFVCVLGLPIFLLTSHAYAQEAQAANASSLLGFGKALGAGLAIGLAVIGGALAQGRTASAALEGIARNPGATGKIFTPFILGMALIESLVIFSLLIAFLLLP